MDKAHPVIEAGRYMLTNNLAWGTSGNISIRLNTDNMLITASGRFMGNLSPEEFI